MKLMAASDIHGSALYCRHILEAYKREGAERLLLLGDLLYHGPRNPLPEGYAPKETAAMLNTYREKLLCVRGNCDAEIDQAVLDFPILAEYAVLMIGSRVAFVTHGDHYNLDRLPPLQPGDLLLHGHTHVPAWEQFGRDNWYLNPGSVSLPKDGTSRGYMILTEKEIFWKTLDGTVYHSVEI